MNKALIGISIILLMQLIGTVVSYYLLPILPGSVIGMVLLFVALQFRIVKEENLEGVVDFFMSNMTLFFLPSAVGIITVLPLVSNNLLSISLAVVLSTIFVMLSVGLCQQFLEKKSKGSDDVRE